MSNRFNENEFKRKFKKFSVQTYRRILKAWITPNDSLTTHSDESKSQFDHSLEAFDNQTDQTLNESKTIDLNDSLDSIPETPEFVEKRKSLEMRDKKRKMKKRLISEFIDFEAEVDSKDSFCDDFEDTQKEMENYSQSVIDDIIPMDTQPIGQLIGGIDSRRAEDMKTVYLRSVKDNLIGKTDKYKLQYNYDPNIEVFSQEPNEQDLEDYQFDSFCVPNDSIEFIESSPKATNTTQMSIGLPSPQSQVSKKSRKKFRRIVFSP